MFRSVELVAPVGGRSKVGVTVHSGDHVESGEFLALFVCTIGLCIISEGFGQSCTPSHMAGSR